jgi:hypothetical protein
LAYLAHFSGGNAGADHAKRERKAPQRTQVREKRFGVHLAFYQLFVSEPPATLSLSLR